MKQALIAAASALVIAVALAGSANAQQSGGANGASATAQAGEGDVIVSARKRPERLQDVPMAATVINRDQLNDKGGSVDVKSVFTAVPGLAIADTSSPVTSELSLRGSGTSRGTTAENGVGLYVDGAFIGGGTIGGRTFADIDLFDAGQIDILRGTQGALYGRDAVGGAINVLTARPTQTASGLISVKGGTEDYGEVQAIINQPLTDDLSMRISGDLSGQQKGFYYNPVLNRYFDAKATQNIRGQLRYNKGPLDVNLMIEHSSDKLPALDLAIDVSPPNANFPKGYVENPFILPRNSPGIDREYLNVGELSVSYDLNFATLSSVSMYRDRKTIQGFDQDDFSPALLASLFAAGIVSKKEDTTVDPNDFQINHDDTQNFDQETYISSKSGSRLQWLAGIEYLYIADNDQIQSTTAVTALPEPGTRSVSTQHTSSFAAYGSLGYDITTKLNLTGELRYTYDDKTFTSNQFNNVTGVPSGPQFLNDNSTSPSNLSYNVTANYKFASDFMAYAKVGTAFRGGGFNNNLGSPGQPTPVPVSYGNENTISYEIGTKGNLTRHLYFTTAAYYTDVNNLIIQNVNGCGINVAACPVTQTLFSENGGNAYVWGVEVEATETRHILGGDAALTLAVSRQDGRITSGVFNHDAPPQVPGWIASASLDYSHPFYYDTNLDLDVSYTGRYDGVQEIAQTPILYPYSLVDAKIGVRKGRWEVDGFVHNLGNVMYIEFGAASAVRYNEPRTGGAELIYKW